MKGVYLKRLKQKSKTVNAPNQIKKKTKSILYKTNRIPTKN
jgi:hypothetical protein